MKKIYAIAGAITLAACATVTVPAVKDGLVEYYGSQKNIFATGKAEGQVPLAAMSGTNGAFGVGAYEGLDGEITVFDGKVYVTKVRGNGYTMDNSQNGSAIFSVPGRRTRNGATSRCRPTSRAISTCSATSRRTPPPRASTSASPSPSCSPAHRPR
jgi:hypothetical protein